jgi:hypothetical protein
MQYAPGRLLTPIAGGGTPSLDLNFLGGATADTLDSRITFSRAGMAWQYDSGGVLVTAPHNSLTESQSFDAAVWGKTNCTVTGNAAVSPLGATTADLVTGTATTVHASQSAVVVPLGARIAVSVYAKQGPAANTFMRLRIASGAEVGSQWFNLTTGAAGTTTSSANIVVSSPTSTDAGSGWWRVSAIFTTTGFTSMTIGMGPANSNGNGGLSGDTVYLWGGQCELHSAVRPYLNTTVRNMLGYSDQFDNAAWVKTAVTVTANTVTAPDGTLTADKLVDTATSSNHEAAETATVVSGTAYTFSCYFKAGERTIARMVASSGLFGASNTTWFNLALGTVGTNQGATTAAITDVGGGWFRCSYTRTATSSGSSSFYVSMSTADGTNGYAGVAGEGLYIWGAQLANSGSLTTYVATTAAAPSSAAYYGPRLDYDPVTLTARGLLIEEARTNQLPGTMTGGTYWTGAAITLTTGATAPDGTTNAVTLTQSAGGTTTYGSSPLVGVFATITASTPTTASIFAKAGTCTFLRMFLTDSNTPTISSVVWFNLGTGVVGTQTNSGGPTSTSSTMTSVGNGWYRCTITATLGSATTATILIRMASADAVTTDVGSKAFSVYNPQLEGGSSFPSSPILTTTAAVTRAADVATITPLGSWFSTTEGTVQAEFSFPDLFGSINSTVWELDDGTTNARLFLYGTSTTATNFDIRVGGVQQINILRSGWLTAGGVAKVACAWTTNDCQAAFGGTLGTADTSVTIPTGLTTLRLGATSSATQGRTHLRALRYYSRRLPNSTQQVITV